MDLAPALGWLTRPFCRPEPAVVVTVWNGCDCEVRLPQHFVHVVRGHVALEPEDVLARLAVPPGRCGTLRFAAAGAGATAAGAGGGGDFAAAAELEVCGGEERGTLLLAAAGARVGPSRFAVRWGAFGGQPAMRELLRELPTLSREPPFRERGANEEPEASQIGAGAFCAWVSCSGGGGAGVREVEVTLCRRGEAPVPRVAAPMAAPVWGARRLPAPPGGKRLVVTVVNHTGTGITFPPDFANMAAGEVWKEQAYVGADQTGVVAFYDDALFSGTVFCKIGEQERLFLEATNPLVGPRTFRLRFAGVGTEAAPEPPLLPGRRVAGWVYEALSTGFRGSGLFLGVPEDAVVSGKGFEALVTDARDGDDASVTVALYALPGGETRCSAAAARGARCGSPPSAHAGPCPAAPAVRAR